MPEKTVEAWKGERRMLLRALRDLWETSSRPHGPCGRADCVFCRVEAILSMYE